MSSCFHGTRTLPRRQAEKEPAWHRRARAQRSEDRVLLRIVAAATRLAKHHGSAVPSILRGLVDKASSGRQPPSAAPPAATAPSAPTASASTPTLAPSASQAPSWAWNRTATPFTPASTQMSSSASAPLPSSAAAMSCTTASSVAAPTAAPVPVREAVPGRALNPFSSALPPSAAASSCTSRAAQETQNASQIGASHAPSELVSKTNATVSDDELISLFVSDLQVADIPGKLNAHFKIMKSQPLRKLLEAYCKRAGLQVSQVRFMVEDVLSGDQKPVTPHDTADQLNLEDEDVIFVIDDS